MLGKCEEGRGAEARMIEGSEGQEKGTNVHLGLLLRHTHEPGLQRLDVYARDTEEEGARAPPEMVEAAIV